jgi:hypothetical protein
VRGLPTPPAAPTTSLRRRRRLPGALAEIAADSAGAWLLPAPVYHAVRRQLSG